MAYHSFPTFSNVADILLVSVMQPKQHTALPGAEVVAELQRTAEAVDASALNEPRLRSVLPEPMPSVWKWAVNCTVQYWSWNFDLQFVYITDYCIRLSYIIRDRICSWWLCNDAVLSISFWTPPISQVVVRSPTACFINSKWPAGLCGLPHRGCHWSCGQWSREDGSSADMTVCSSRHPAVPSICPKIGCHIQVFSQNVSRPARLLLGTGHRKNSKRN